MSVRFRPGRAKKAQSNVLVSVGAVGDVKHWHLGSQKCLHTAVEKVHRPPPPSLPSYSFPRVVLDRRLVLIRNFESGRAQGVDRMTKRPYTNQIFALEYSRSPRCSRGSEPRRAGSTHSLQCTLQYRRALCDGR